MQRTSPCNLVKRSQKSSFGSGSWVIPGVVESVTNYCNAFLDPLSGFVQDTNPVSFIFNGA